MFIWGYFREHPFFSALTLLVGSFPRKKTVPDMTYNMCVWWDVKPYSINQSTTGTELPDYNESSAELTTANGGTFTSCSARLSSQSRYRTLDQ